MTSSSPPTLRVGIAGVGGGASQMVPAFQRHGSIKITAAADVDDDVLARFKRDLEGETYRSVEDMCKSPNVDLVYVATPNQFHTEHALTALDHHKHVHLEKPMTLNMEEAQTIVNTAERNGLQLTVNVKHSFEPRIQKIREIVRGGELGNLRMMHNWFYNDWLYRPRVAEELDPRLGGGVVWRQGPHHFDIIRTIGGGMLRSVRAMTGLWDDTRPVTGAFAAFLEFQDGAAATSVYNGYDRFHSNDLVFDVGEPYQPPDTASYARARKSQRQRGADAEVEAKRANRYGGGNAPAPAGQTPTAAARRPTGAYILGGPEVISLDLADIRLTPAGIMVYGPDDRYEIDLTSDRDGRDGIIAQVYNGIAHSRPPTPDGRWGMATLEVLLAVNQSGAEHREVLLSHQVPSKD